MNLLLETNQNKFKIICVVNCHIGTLNCSWCFTIWFWFDSGNSSTSQAGQDRQCIRFIYSTSRAYLNKQCGCHSVLSLLWFQMGKIFLNEFVDISTFWQTLLMRRFSWLMATLCCWSFFAKVAWTGNMADSFCISPIYLNDSSSILKIKVSAENKFRKLWCESECKNIKKV